MPYEHAYPRAAGLAADPPELLDDLEQGHYFHYRAA